MTVIRNKLQNMLLNDLASVDIFLKLEMLSGSIVVFHVF